MSARVPLPLTPLRPPCGRLLWMTPNIARYIRLAYDLEVDCKSSGEKVIARGFITRYFCYDEANYIYMEANVACEFQSKFSNNSFADNHFFQLFKN